ncbi:MAG: Uma2 family endonuclease [Prochlorotrichaceae cyanobacterium]|jgi:Uma2 family endonuclease
MVAELTRPPALLPLQVAWEALPDDYPIPDDPVDNRTQPLLAAALTNSLSQADRLPDQSMTITNYPLCAKVNDQMVLKAPDWAYIYPLAVSKESVNRSYTPQLQGAPPTIVMEFLSHKDGGEYSSKPTYPPGKWFFYEQILKVPYYAIFEPDSGDLEVYHLNEMGRYKMQMMENNGRYWLDAMQLFLGVWQGTGEDRTGYWLRWWDQNDRLLLWSSEQAEEERQRAERERQRADRLLAQLQAAGIEPDLSDL